MAALPVIRKQLPLSPETAERVSQYRHRRQMPSEARALVDLIERGLEAAEREQAAAAAPDAASAAPVRDAA